METAEKLENGRWMHAATIAGIAASIAFIIYGWKRGIFVSEEAMADFLRPFGIWAPVIFILIQIVQVVIPILPGGISCLGGVILFGAVRGFLYNYIGICIGSVAAFLIAKQYGRSMVRSMIGEKSYEKYSKWLDGGKKFDRCFAIAIFSPVAPDDILCYIAGLTKMSLRKFTAIILLGKPTAIGVYSAGLLLLSKSIAGIM